MLFSIAEVDHKLEYGGKFNVNNNGLMSFLWKICVFNAVCKGGAFLRKYDYHPHY